jgi:energy-coupling factor transporter ATP-binding protein EcfA2
MTKKVIQDSQLNSSEVDRLIVLCEEVTRATPEGVRRFIEPAPGVLSKAKSKQHHIIFGRRGSGKSSLLRKMAADLTIDRRPIAFVDMETFKGHSYPDVLISVLIKSLHEFKKWLDSAAIAPSSKSSFWKRLFGTIPNRQPFNKAKTSTLATTLESIIRDLEIQLRAPETASKQIKETCTEEQTAGAEFGITAKTPRVGVNSKASLSAKSVGTTEEQSIYVSHKVEYLHQNILRFQGFFQELSQLSDGPSFLILDDLYHIRKADQAKVIDYFHRIAKGNDMWLKAIPVNEISRIAVQG